MSNLKLIPLYLLYLTTFGAAAASKLIPLTPFGAPDWFQKQFGETFLNAFPGALSLNFYLIAVMELTITLGFFVSLFRKEFLPGRKKCVLQAMLLLAQLNFVILGFGLRIVHDFQGAANLFFYFGFTFLVSRWLENGTVVSS
jgi:hypothetical protein